VQAGETVTGPLDRRRSSNRLETLRPKERLPRYALKREPIGSHRRCKPRPWAAHRAYAAAVLAKSGRL